MEHAEFVEFTWYKHWMYQLGNGLNIQLGLGLGLIHFMSIYLRLAFFLERGSSGECFILLILLCRNISDMVQEHIHHPQQTSRTKVALTFMNGAPSSQRISPSSQSPFRKASSS